MRIMDVITNSGVKIIIVNNDDIASIIKDIEELEYYLSDSILWDLKDDLKYGLDS